MIQAVKQIYAVQLLRMEKIMKKKTPKLVLPFILLSLSLPGAGELYTKHHTESCTQKIMLYTKQIDCPEFLQGFTNKQTHSSVEHPSPAWWLLAAGHGGDAVRTRTHVFLKP